MKKPKLGKIFTKKRLKILIPLLILIVLAGIGFSVVKSLSAPAEGSISQTPLKEAESTDPYAEPGHYDGKYVSFNYPAHYKKTPSKLTGSYLEVYSLGSTNYTSRQITIGVSPGELYANSGVVARKLHPDVYKPLPETRYGIGFSNSQNGSEQTYYTAHGDKVASISVTSPGNADLSADALYVLTSLKWK